MALDQIDMRLIDKVTTENDELRRKLQVAKEALQDCKKECRLDDCWENIDEITTKALKELE